MNTPRAQLIHAAHTAAQYLPKATAGIITELATRFDTVSVALAEAMEQRRHLIAENVRLKAELEAQKNG